MASAATGSATTRCGLVRTAITKTITKLHDADTGTMCDEQKCFEIGAKLGALRDKHAQVLLLDAERVLTCMTDQETIFLPTTIYRQCQMFFSSHKDKQE